MSMLSELVNIIRSELSIRLRVVSGGNSANYEWANSDQMSGEINNLRIGESYSFEGVVRPSVGRLFQVFNTNTVFG